MVYSKKFIPDFIFKSDTYFLLTEPLSPSLDNCVGLFIKLTGLHIVSVHQLHLQVISRPGAMVEDTYRRCRACTEWENTECSERENTEIHVVAKN